MLPSRPYPNPTPTTLLHPHPPLSPLTLLCFTLILPSVSPPSQRLPPWTSARLQSFHAPLSRRWRPGCRGGRRQVGVDKVVQALVTFIKNTNVQFRIPSEDWGWRSLVVCWGWRLWTCLCGTGIILVVSLGVFGLVLCDVVWRRGGGQWRWGWRCSGPCPSSLSPSRRRGQRQVYRACVLSSIGSPRVSCWVSLSGGRLPFSVARRSDRPLMRGNSMKSYRRAPMAPPIIGPTQYTCWQQTSSCQLTQYSIIQGCCRLTSSSRL